MSKLNNLQGKRYGSLIVIRREGKDDFGKSTWSCACDCGRDNVIVTGRCLTNKITTSCGKCLERTLIGERYDRLLVVSYSHAGVKGDVYFKCKCDCGTEKIISYRCLKTGQTKSCGCKKREHLYNLNKRDTGEACFNRIYARYKKRATEKGYSFDLTKEYFKHLINQNCSYCGKAPQSIEKNKYGMGDYIYNGIDRINNNKGYEKENVMTCCSICNHGKNAMEKKEFFDWINAVYNFSASKEIRQ